MKKLFRHIIILFIIIFSCKSIENIQNSYPYNEAEKLNYNGYIYALPKTIINIEFQITEQIFTKGPYHEYAEKYLGITDVSHTNYENWKITDINIITWPEIDIGQYYIARLSEQNRINLLKLKEKGHILDLFNFDFINNPNLLAIPESSDEFPFFTDLSIKRNFAEGYDTIYKKIKKDTTHIEVPILKTKPEQKSLEQKAEDAANFIIKIRKRRFKLLSGQYDFYPEAEAIKFAIEELNKLEEEYVSLFIGKKTEKSFTHYFEYIPEKDINIDAQILFRFSEEKGILDKNDTDGRQILLVLKQLDVTEVFKNPNNTIVNSEPIREKAKDDDYVNTELIIRIPEIVRIEIMDGKELLIKYNVPVHQLGKIVSLPVNLIDDNLRNTDETEKIN